jgi:hypothetical protein
MKIEEKRKKKRKEKKKGHLHQPETSLAALVAG